MTTAVAPTADVRDDGAADRTAAWARIPWALVALAVPALIGVIRLVVSIRRPFDLWGDHAIFETAIRRVATGTQALGPYSRFGFHQPGPAYFEAQAPFYWLSGASPRALFVGALCLNLGAGLGCVLVIRRFLGEGPARWTAVVLGTYLLAATPALASDPWPVYVLSLPFLLTVLLAAAAHRSVAAGGGALIGATYLVQTHVATAATVVVLLGLAAALTVAPAAFRRWRPGTAIAAGPLPRIGWPALAATATVLAVMWVPPALEQVTRHPGNVTTLARFFRASHPEADAGIDHSLRTSAGQVARQLSLLPLGRRSDPGPAGPLDVAVAATGLLVATGVAAAGWRRRNRFLLMLGIIPLVGTPVAIWSASRIVGEPLPYLLLWTSALLLPAWIGAGALLLTSPRLRRRPLLVSRALVGGLVAATIASGWAMLRSPSPTLHSSGDVTAVSTLAQRWLAGHAAAHVRILFRDHDEWPLAAGLIDHLERRGADVTVDPSYLFLFGDQFKPNGRDEATIWLTPPGTSPPAGAPLDRLGDAGGASVWAGPAGRP